MDKSSCVHTWVTTVELMHAWGPPAYEPVDYDGGQYTGELLRIPPEHVFCLVCRLTADKVEVSDALENA